ncbi:winged helix-turn-helix transcriptional regulator [Halobacterium rubrum]|nr:helix-turn-helix domain-containing protein [Halobacterium sp. TGN-42-S1]
MRRDVSRIDDPRPDGEIPDEAFDAVRDVLGHKWHLRIVSHLLDAEPLRFSSLNDRIDAVSSKVLSESLSRLEADDVVDRRVVSDKPLSVEYTLTESGAALQPVVEAAVDWGLTHGATSYR